MLQLRRQRRYLLERGRRRRHVRSKGATGRCDQAHDTGRAKQLLRQASPRVLVVRRVPKNDGAGVVQWGVHGAGRELREEEEEELGARS